MTADGFVPDGNVHTYPCNDVIEHDINPDCICGPDVTRVTRDDGSDGWFYVHHALDGREFRERGEQLPRGMEL